MKTRPILALAAAAAISFSACGGSSETTADTDAQTHFFYAISAYNDVISEVPYFYSSVDCQKTYDATVTFFEAIESYEWPDYTAEEAEAVVQRLTYNRPNLFLCAKDGESLAFALA